LIPWVNETLWDLFCIHTPHIALFSWDKAAMYAAQITTGTAFLYWITKREPRLMRSARHFQLGFGVSNGLMLFFLLLMIASANLISL
jgi:hypothetical protein